MLNIIFKSTSVLPTARRNQDIYMSKQVSLWCHMFKITPGPLLCSWRHYTSFFIYFFFYSFYGHARRAAGAAQRHKSLQLVFLLRKCSTVIAHRRAHSIHPALCCAQLQVHYSGKSGSLKCTIFVTGTASSGLLDIHMEIHGSGSHL